MLSNQITLVIRGIRGVGDTEGSGEKYAYRQGSEDHKIRYENQLNASLGRLE